MPLPLRSLFRNCRPRYRQWAPHRRPAVADARISPFHLSASGSHSSAKMRSAVGVRVIRHPAIAHCRSTAVVEASSSGSVSVAAPDGAAAVLVPPAAATCRNLAMNSPRKSERMRSRQMPREGRASSEALITLTDVRHISSPQD